MKTKKLFLVFFRNNIESQFLSATEIEVRNLCAGLREIGASYVAIQLSLN